MGYADTSIPPIHLIIKRIGHNGETETDRWGDGDGDGAD
jgi:hypothetical protein